MEYIHPLFDSKMEEVSPPQLAQALGFKVEIASERDFDDPDCDGKDYALGYLYNKGDLDSFFHLWNPVPPVGYVLAGKYDTEDGPFAFFAKPDTMTAAALLNFYENEFVAVALVGESEQDRGQEFVKARAFVRQDDRNTII